uniref:NB-ARC domain-containing protein n=1 Tax=Setaria viridis TaxID=4556 RepID=A0A4V6D2V9_SETVI|nr:hypothetical protein SEVIR_8G090200v2 [Setaria viridis]TKW00167.1 hypothetical protein SEVIR_8G090200v2 [Setaria viridis]
MVSDLWSAFMDNLVSRLSSLVEEKYNLYKGFEADVTFLMRELPMVTSAINNQFLGQEDDHILCLLVEELREVAHEMEDCIDHITYNASWEQQSWYSNIIEYWKKRKSRSQLGEEMQRLKRRLEEVFQRQERYSVSLPSKSSQVAKSSSDQHVLPDDLIGIDAPLEELLRQLAEMEGQLKQLKVITIVGFSGLGKTVLARELYNSEVGKKFQVRAWVTAMHGDPKKLLVDILQQLHKPPLDTSNSNGYQLSTNLSNYLNNKRYFIVIDDMRSDQWGIIKAAFPRDVSSRIVVTTRIQSVANTCSSTNGYIHKMRRLGDKHSRQLLLKKACGVEHSDYLQPNLAEISKKCDGQPLALTTVGQFLRNKGYPTAYDCEDMCKVRFYPLRSGDQTLDRLRQVLIHEYTSLPSHVLRACFLYFAMFTSDHPVRTKRLMRQWLAEGLVLRSNSGTDPAVENFKNLMDKNIIQPIDVSNNMNVKTCKTYGMMHEFIALKSHTENLIAFCDDGKLNPRRARRLSLCDSSITDARNLEFDLSLVRSLIIIGKAGKTILDFSNYQLLRVLDLEQCADLDNDHLKDICNLLLLKYLSLGSKITKLPDDIIRLRLLETLDLRRTAVRILHPEVIKLPNLINLFGKFKLQNKFVQSELQKSIASGKCKLQTLAGFIVDQSDESDGFAEVMIHMKQLRKVKIWCESTATSTNLTTLQKAIQEFIRDEKDACYDPRSLSLHFDGCSEDLMKDLKAPCYLRSLKLQDLTKLKHLQYLKLVADELDGITIEDKSLPRLLCLCFVLQRPTFPNIEEGALPFLESLQLLCKDMDGLSGIQIKGFTRLRDVMLDGRVTDGTKANWVRAANEHPNRPKVLLKRAIPPKVDSADLGGDSAASGTTENEIVDCYVLSEGQVQETHAQMPHDGPDSSFNNMGHQVVCVALTGSSIANNGRVAS